MLHSGRARMAQREIRKCHLNFFCDRLWHHLAEKVVALLHLTIQLCHALLMDNIGEESNLFTSLHLLRLLVFRLQCILQLVGLLTAKEMDFIMSFCER